MSEAVCPGGGGKEGGTSGGRFCVLHYPTTKYSRLLPLVVFGLTAAPTIYSIARSVFRRGVRVIWGGERDGDDGRDARDFHANAWEVCFADSSQQTAPVKCGACSATLRGMIQSQTCCFARLFLCEGFDARGSVRKGCDHVI